MNTFIEAARKYQGVPFFHQGRCDVGLDCFGLILKSYEDVGFLGNKELEAVSKDKNISKYSRLPDSDVFINTFFKPCFDDVGFSGMKSGDIILFKIAGALQHVAIYVFENGVETIIHSNEMVGKVVEHRFDAKWKRRAQFVFSLKK